MESLINDVGLDPTEYSWAKIKRNGVTVDFEKKWREVAVKPFGYIGVNAFGIDFGGKR